MTQHLPAPIASEPPAPSSKVILASYLLMAAVLLLIMHQGLLPGLLTVCVGFLLTRSLTRLLSRADKRPRPTKREKSSREKQLRRKSLFM